MTCGCIFANGNLLQRAIGCRENHATPRMQVCQCCRQRPAEQDWAEEGEGIRWALAHGAKTARWCKLCVLTAQLEHAQSAARRIPRLQQEIEEEAKRWTKE